MLNQQNPSASEANFIEEYAKGCHNMDLCSLTKHIKLTLDDEFVADIRLCGDNTISMRFVGGETYHINIEKCG